MDFSAQMQGWSNFWKQWKQSKQQANKRAAKVEQTAYKNTKLSLD